MIFWVAQLLVKHAIIFFDAKGVINKGFLTNGKTVTGQFYLGVLRSLKDRVRQFKRILLTIGSSITTTRWITRHPLPARFGQKEDYNVGAPFPSFPSFQPANTFFSISADTNEHSLLS